MFQVLFGESIAKNRVFEYVINIFNIFLNKINIILTSFKDI